jgi:hypothetical protein
MSFDKIFKGFTPPDLQPDFGSLNEAVKGSRASGEDVAAALNKRLEEAASEKPGPIKALTLEESIEQAKLIDDAKMQVRQTMDRLASFSNGLDLQLSEQNKIGYKLNISKRRNLRTATRQLYGEAKDAITYQMYKELKALKAKLDKESTEDYVKGDWGNT